MGIYKSHWARYWPLFSSLIWIWFSSLVIGGEVGLGRTWERLARNKELVIGYFGGSITEGAGASKADQTSWRAITTTWFKTKYPGAKISEINAAIGGTGSELGAFRCRRDLLSKHPDLVFIEFAVNDSKFPEEIQIAAMEGIVRQIWSDNRNAEIVFVYTTMKGAEAYSKDGELMSMRCQQRIANYYGIPEVNVGKALLDAMKAGKGDWETLTKDGTHPVDAGYAIYAEKVAEFLESHRNDRPQQPVALPHPLSGDPYEHVQMVDAWEVQAGGWIKENQSLANRLPHRISSCTPGSELVFPFSGNAVGVYWLMAGDGGNVEYSIDNGPVCTAASWDRHAANCDRAYYKMLGSGLPNGPHTLRLKVAGTKSEQSRGYWIRIGAFLVR